MRSVVAAVPLWIHPHAAQAFRVVAGTLPWQQVAAGLGSGGVGTVVDALDLDRVEEALHRRVVEAVFRREMVVRAAWETTGAAWNCDGCEVEVWRRPASSTK